MSTNGSSLSLLGDGTDAADMVFDLAEQTLYVAGRDGFLRSYDVTTGQLLRSMSVGQSLGGMDIAPIIDSPVGGRGYQPYVIITEQEPVSSSIDQYGNRTYVVSSYKVDLKTMAVTRYDYAAPGYDHTFFDVALMANGQILLTQDFRGSGWVNLKSLNTFTGEYTDLGISLRNRSILSTSEDHRSLFVGEADISNAQMDFYKVGGLGSDLTLSGTNGSSGFNRGVQAVNENGTLVANYVYGGGLLIFDQSLAFVRNLANEFPQWQSGQLEGLAFNQGYLYVLDAGTDEVVKISTADWSVAERFALGYDYDGPGSQFGNGLLVTDSGYLFVNGAHGVSELDMLGVYGTDGADTLTGDAGANRVYGMNGDDQLTGGGGADVLSGGLGNDSLDGGAGADKMIGGLGDDIYRVGETGDRVIEQAGQGHDRVISSIEYTLGPNVEDLQLTDSAFYGGGNALDNVIIGNDVGNLLRDTLAGNDVLIGEGGDDTIETRTGNNVAVGGAGEDRVLLFRPLSTYSYLEQNGHTYLIGEEGSVRFEGIETVQFWSQQITAGTVGTVVSSFDARRYVAGYQDLMVYIGDDAAQATAHYDQYGFDEGRDAKAFDPLSYLAGYQDLMAAFGINAQAALDHYFHYGYYEGRNDDAFAPLEYVAGYDDLIAAIGVDTDKAAQHYIAFGYGEGRNTHLFDGLEYVASNPDLITTIGDDTEMAAAHYISWGAGEGRSVNSFDALDYAAANADLAAVFGNDVEALTRHYIDVGFYEGRSIHASPLGGDLIL